MLFIGVVAVTVTYKVLVHVPFPHKKTELDSRKKLCIQIVHEIPHNLSLKKLVNIRKIQPRSQRIFWLSEEGEKEALEHFKHLIKICPNRGYIFSE